jgi:hypothetical protein
VNNKRQKRILWQMKSSRRFENILITFQYESKNILSEMERIAKVQEFEQNKYSKKDILAVLNIRYKKNNRSYDR